MPFAPEIPGNYVQTILIAPLTSSATSLTVSSSAGFPTPPFRVLLQSLDATKREIVKVTVIVGNVWTVTRGFESVPNFTGSYAFNPFDTVAYVLTAGALQNNPGAMTTVGDLQTLDASGNVVRIAMGASSIVANVLGFGAVGDNATNNTTAFQNALNAVATAGGGMLYVPPGNYRFSGNLTIPVNVTLQGSYQGALSHTGIRDGTGGAGAAQLPTAGGSCLLPTGGAGTTALPAFITVGTNATLRGFCIYYPNQVTNTGSGATPPTTYPPAIAMRGSNPNLENVELLNAYSGVDINNYDGTAFGLTSRPTVRNVTGQPLFKGIRLGNANDNAGGSNFGITDIARFENVHFNPWYAYSNNLFTWQQNNATAFDIGDADEIEFKDCFCYGYSVGILLQSFNRGPYGSWLGGGFDFCQTCVNATGIQAQGGFRFVNTGMVVTGATGACVNKTSGAGDLRFVSCNFWGFGNTAPIFVGGGNNEVTMFTSCHFRNYTTPALSSTGGHLLVNGCTFENGGVMMAQSGSSKQMCVNCMSNTIPFSFTGTVTQDNNIVYP